MFKPLSVFALFTYSVLSLTLVSCSDKTETPETPSTTVLSESKAPTAYAFSMLAPAMDGATLVYGRVVLSASGQSCPALNGSDGSELATSLRPMYPDVKTTSADFPITVCEAVLEPGVSYRNQDLGIALNATNLDVERVAVFGDSGCHSDKTCAGCLLYTSPSPRDGATSRMPSSA